MRSYDDPSCPDGHRPDPERERLLTPWRRRAWRGTRFRRNVARPRGAARRVARLSWAPAECGSIVMSLGYASGLATTTTATSMFTLES